MDPTGKIELLARRGKGGEKNTGIRLGEINGKTIPPHEIWRQWTILSDRKTNFSTGSGIFPACYSDFPSC